MADRNLDQLKSELSTEVLLDYYNKMLRFRRMSEKTAQLYQQGTIGGFCHLYTGQEAVLAGTFAACKEGDDHITSYRCHAHALACGIDEKAILAELAGKATGISKGKGGSMHMFEPSKGYWGGHGIVGAQVPLGTGIAFYHKYMKNENICVTSYGDGAANQGQVFEAMNMASLWGLPVLYIIENNVYGMGTAAKRVCAGELYQRGQAFDIEGEKIEGQDFFSVFEAVARARKYILENKRPYIIEMDTYRYRGHSMSDPAKYRSKEEVQAVKENRDPLIRMFNYLVDDRGVTEDTLKEMDKVVKAHLQEAVDFAANSPLPDASELMTDILAK
jgi:pyruvate dehydrogenase E1 component alpha subunit